MAWTKDQEKAINITDKNILVSAAAGSGKTAVLTERIVKGITSGKWSADRLVVVTFTKAAAAEMKERIHKELEKALAADPENKRIYTQLTLLQDACITTIHSFCQNIIRTHFEEAGIDPDFRVAETGEVRLLESDVFDQVLENFYEENDQDFYDFVSAFGGKKSDDKIEDIVKGLYLDAINNPWPDEWFENICDISNVTDENALYDNPVIGYMLENTRMRAAGFKDSLEKMLPLLTQENGLDAYYETAMSDMRLLEKCVDASDCEEMYKSLLAGTEPGALKRAKNGADESVKTRFKNIRGDKSRGKGYIGFFNTYAVLFRRITDKETGVMAEVKNTAGSLDVLVRLTKAFSNELEKQKRERNIITFNDMEHMALDILVKRENGESRLTDAAYELKEQYDEILVDEYQDSNFIQEEILNAVSNGHNRYMVGDVKQSIYGFRKARPEIFIGKYDYFTTEDICEDQKILLQQNFRSRENVLESVNCVFEHAMNKEFCGMGYGKEEELIHGLEYPEPTSLQTTFEGNAGKTCIEYIFEAEEERRDKSLLEAGLIAMKIKELFAAGYMVYDKETKGYRKLKFRDIVILARTKSNFDETVEVLMDAGISAYALSEESYLETFELRPIISLLKVLDNPLDDIAMASVMLSYFGEFDADELARVRVTDRYEFLYNNLKVFAESEDGEEALKEKVKDFLDMLDDLRVMAGESSVYDTIWRIVYDTGYYRYMATVGAGEKRLANIELLLNRAAVFSGTSYNGLFQFLRYIEKIKEAREEVGEVSVLSENEDVVRLTTIHKSKGLEYPVVFIMGATKGFRLTDDKEVVVCHDSLGIALRDIDLKRRTKKKTVFKSAVIDRINRDEISEELRLLYVAMTRAREKLYIVGTGKDEDTEKLLKVAPGEDFGINDLYGLRNYLEACMPAALSTKGGRYFEINKISSDEITETRLEPSEYNKESSEETSEIKLPVDEPYAFEGEISKKPKVTVTELKTAAHVDDEEKARDYRLEVAESETEEEKSVRENRGKRNGGISRGNAYHKLMEHLKFDDTDIQAQIDALVSKGLTDSESAGKIKTDDITCFLESDIGQRAKEAFQKGTLHREQEFMIGIPQDDISDLLLVQGVIDMYIEDEDGITLVDYKTDYVKKSDGEKVLTDRYGQQLSYYAKALEQATGKAVKEKIIYSFALGREIYL